MMYVFTIQLIFLLLKYSEGKELFFCERLHSSLCQKIINTNKSTTNNCSHLVKSLELNTDSNPVMITETGFILLNLIFPECKNLTIETSNKVYKVNDLIISLKDYVIEINYFKNTFFFEEKFLNRLNVNKLKKIKKNNKFVDSILKVNTTKKNVANYFIIALLYMLIMLF